MGGVSTVIGIIFLLLIVFVAIGIMVMWLLQIGLKHGMDGIRLSCEGEGEKGKGE